MVCMEKYEGAFYNAQVESFLCNCKVQSRNQRHFLFWEHVCISNQSCVCIDVKTAVYFAMIYQHQVLSDGRIPCRSNWNISLHLIWYILNNAVRDRLDKILSWESLDSWTTLKEKIRLWAASVVLTDGLALSGVRTSADMLPHWGWDKMADIFQTTFSNAFSWMKMLALCIQFDWSFFLKVQLTILEHWFILAPRSWTNDGLVCWCIYVSLGLNELMTAYGSLLTGTLTHWGQGTFKKCLKAPQLKNS